MRPSTRKLRGSRRKRERRRGGCGKTRRLFLRGFSARSDEANRSIHRISLCWTKLLRHVRRFLRGLHRHRSRQFRRFRSSATGTATCITDQTARITARFPPVIGSSSPARPKPKQQATGSPATVRSTRGDGQELVLRPERRCRWHDAGGNQAVPAPPPGRTASKGGAVRSHSASRQCV
jgi:hypothetical protein